MKIKTWKLKPFQQWFAELDPSHETHYDHCEDCYGQKTWDYAIGDHFLLIRNTSKLFHTPLNYEDRRYINYAQEVFQAVIAPSRFVLNNEREHFIDTIECSSKEELEEWYNSLEEKINSWWCKYIMEKYINE